MLFNYLIIMKIAHEVHKRSSAL